MSNRNHVEGVESCDFSCEAGPLTNNTDWQHIKTELDKLRAELEAAKQDAAKCAAAHINAVSACNENAHLLTKASAELAELRARAGELERQVRDKHEAATVDEICNAYESGVGHRGRPTASVNPYRQGSDLATAYNIGALGDRESPAAAAVPDDVAKDAERYRACRRAALAADNDPLIEQMLDWPNVSTADEFDIQADQIAAILAAKEKGQ